MEATEVRTTSYGVLILLLAVLSVGSALTITSCGGSGSTNGELCDQCGDDPDGRCQGELGIPPYMVPAGTDAPCDDPSMNPPCELSLSCLRKAGSAQRRCFPFDADPQFRCDGERANPQTRTPMPRTATPLVTVTPAATGVTATPTSTAASSTPDATCGDGLIEDGEECDGTDSADICEDFCDGNDPTPVTCGTDCKFDFTGCTNPAGCDPNGPPGG